ncbi:MAG: hypothetical protein KG075_17090 [Alphaproteobacteria bacterium]|nr:hypothetical protein [Alphaproteobacteria bacterium]
MDYDDVIERAAKALCEASGGFWRTGEGFREPFASDQRALNNHWRHKVRAAAPILMEYGARLMREAVLPDVQTERTIENHGAHCRCTTCELNITEDSIRDLDPATIVREAVK